MRTSLKLSVVAASLLALTACNQEPKQEAPVQLENDAQKQSYSIGASVGGYLKNQIESNKEIGVEIDADLVVRGLQDALDGKEALTPEETRTILTNLEQTVREKQQAMQEIAANKNVEAGKKFLEENGKREGVVTTESGLQYEILKEGAGPQPAATDTVTVHYHGTLIDGTVFDSSVERDQPASFPLNRVIAGWTEGVQLMKEGSKFKFFIPSNLAYGERATGKITPNSTLIFDVELLSVQQAGE